MVSQPVNHNVHASMITSITCLFHLPKTIYQSPNTAVKPGGPSNNKTSAVLLLSVDEDYYNKFAQIK